MSEQTAVVFLDIELTAGAADRHRAVVSLQRAPGEPVIGAAEDVDQLRAAAQATVNALLQILGASTTSLIIRRVEPLDTFGTAVVGVAMSGQHEGKTRKLMGFAQVTGEPAQAAALAVLNATNRFLRLR